MGSFEDTALPFYFSKQSGATRIRYIFTEDKNSWISSHFLFQNLIHAINQCLGAGSITIGRLAIKLSGCGIHFFAVEVSQKVLGAGSGASQASSHPF